MRKSINSKSAVFISLVVLLIIAVGLAYLNNRASSSNKEIPSVNDSSKELPANVNGSTSLKDSQADKLTHPAASGGSDLSSPTGTFISNHRVSLSGASNQKAEQSTCSTTPGAVCYISLTNGPTIKTLSPQTVDGTGTTYWSWNIDDGGLYEGSWKISAIAKLNGVTKTSSDPTNLTISK